MDNRTAIAANDRIQRILGHPESYGREALAHHLAVKTNETLASAVGIMRASGRDRGAAPVLDVAGIYARRRSAAGR